MLGLAVGNRVGTFVGLAVGMGGDDGGYVVLLRSVMKKIYLVAGFVDSIVPTFPRYCIDLLIFAYILS